MSRTIVSPKSGRNLFKAPDNGIDCALIGRICCVMDAPYINRSFYTTEDVDIEPLSLALMPYKATKKECQEMAGALLNVPDDKLEKVFHFSKRCFSEDYTLTDFRNFCTFYGRYLKKLKHGYIDCGDYDSLTIEKKLHKLMPRAMLWPATDTEEKFRDWIARPNPDFPGNLSPEDLLWKSVQPGYSHVWDVVVQYIEKRLLGYPT